MARQRACPSLIFLESVDVLSWNPKAGMISKVSEASLKSQSRTEIPGRQSLTVNHPRLQAKLVRQMARATAALRPARRRMAIARAPRGPTFTVMALSAASNCSLLPRHAWTSSGTRFSILPSRSIRTRAFAELSFFRGPGRVPFRRCLCRVSDGFVFSHTWPCPPVP